jgi:hypothetical protein
VARRELTDGGRVVCVGGRAYVEICRRVFGEGKISAPLEGCRSQGGMMNRLKQEVERP